jgi:DNA-binding response OmpR family regulator
LLARLRALVRRGGVAKGSVLKASDLMLDTRTKRVTRAGREIELTPREFALLELLLMNAGNALPKQLLLERVWGYAILADENVVEVYISYLRRKVDAPFDKKLIRTVRGVGYCIDKDAE